MARMSRAVVMPGDGTWELRELRVPDPPPGGAVLRVEAVGMCHSDIDHMHGIVHTPVGRRLPVDPRARDRRAHRRPGCRDRRPLGRQGGPAGRRPRVGAAARRHPRLRPRLRRRRAVRPVRRLRRLHGAAPGDPARTAPRRHPGRGAHRLGAARHRRPVGDRGQARGTRWPSSVPGTSASPRSWRPARPARNGSSSPAPRPTPSGWTPPASWASEEALDIGAADPVERIRELTGDGVHVVIDAASASTATVTQGMQMARRGGTVVIGGLKDRKPVEGFISDWIPMRQLHLHAGFPGDHVKTSVELIRQGRVPDRRPAWRRRHRGRLRRRAQAPGA